MTKGALYHHFGGKEDLFRAVFEQVQRDVSDRAVAEFLGPDAWEALLRGCSLWVDAHLDPSVRRIALQDAGAVLGWEEARAIENRFGAVALRGALRKAMHAGVIERQPLRPLSLLLTGALSEGCLYIADAADAEAARGGRRADHAHAVGLPGAVSTRRRYGTRIALPTTLRFCWSASARATWPNG